MLAERLAKLAFIGAALRAGAGVAKTMAKPVAALAKKKPVETAVGGLMVGAGVLGSRAKYKQYKEGFNPHERQEMMGNTPTPGALG